MEDDMRRILLWLIGLGLCVTEANAQTPRVTSAPADSEIRRILSDRIDVQKRDVGIVVGVIEPKGRRVIAYGSLEKGDKRTLDGDTLVDLATHTSALPRMPANFRPKDPENPYADYTVEALYSFLSSYELPREIGAKFEYSNLGFGLLGQGIAHRAGMDYEQLVGHLSLEVRARPHRVAALPRRRRQDCSPTLASRV
jgi:serine-type D-Ala-D-Ala carboxypeptidase/endopeptidase